MIESKAKDIMTKARTRLVTGYPFFGNVAMRLKLIEDKTIETMATNGKFIKYNPKFVEDQLLSETVAVIAHEVLHVTNGHHLREGTRNHSLWNSATDFSINSILDKEGFDLPEGGLLDPVYGNKCAEDIYAILFEEYEEAKEEASNSESSNESEEGETSEGSGQSPSQDNSGEEEDGDSEESSNRTLSIEDYVEDKFGKQAGEVEPLTSEEGKELTEAEVERELDKLKVEVTQSEMRARSWGTDASNMTSDLKGYIEDKTDWRDTLLNLCQESVSSEFTWNYPDRRHIATGLYLPSADKDSLNTLVIGTDQSSSVSDKEVSLFEGAMKNIVGQVGFEKIYILYFTHNINKVVELDSGEDFTMKHERYYGGTNFHAVTQWIEDEGIEPSCLLFLTDGECRVPLQPTYPVGWCLTPNYSSYTPRHFGLDQYGEIIELEF